MACQPLGLRSGALLGSAVLFGPSLVLLGCVSPWVVKVAARDLSNVGRVVGFFTALSTIGSFLGTVLTGFVLIGLLGVSKIFMLVGALLIALAVTYHVVFRRRLVAAAALLLPFVPLTSPQPTSVMRASGTKAEMVHSVETFYGSIKVIEYSKGVHHTRELAIDGLVQGGIDVRTGASIYGYAYLLGALPRSVQPKGEDALVIGLGAGLVPNWLGQHGVRTDVVDIDPEIARVAQDWFGFKPTGEIIIQDARAFLTRSNQSYDYIVLDVFNGDTTPGHLLSVEALRLVDAHLDDGGVMATNVMGCLGERQSMMGSVVLTMREVFDTVVAYPMFDPQQDMPCGNLILIAYDGSPVDANVGFDELQRMPPGAKNQVVTALQRKTVPPTDPNAFVLTDDYNPIDLYDLDLKEWVRAGIQNETDWEFLL